MTKTSKKRPNYLVITGMVLLLSAIVWNYYADWKVSQLTVTAAKQGWVKHEKKVKTVFANTEMVLTAPGEGEFIPIQEDGRRFKKGEAVARLVPSGVGSVHTQTEIAISAPVSGLFYTKRDGLEEVITPETLMNMDLPGLLSQAESLQTTDPNPAGHRSVSKNAPVGKIVNNLYPSWMFVYLGENDTVSKEDTLKFIIDEQEYSGTVMKLSGQPKGAVIRFTQYIKGTTENRVQEVTWSIKPPSKGMLVPVNSLCTYGEERGVYIEDEGIIRFRNVKVVDLNGEFACLDGIPEGVSVISNPKKGIEGLTMKIKS
jgi:hypothetical protein